MTLIEMSLQKYINYKEVCYFRHKLKIVKIKNVLIGIWHFKVTDRLRLIDRKQSMLQPIKIVFLFFTIYSHKEAPPATYITPSHITLLGNHIKIMMHMEILLGVTLFLHNTSLCATCRLKYRDFIEKTVLMQW